MAKKEFKKIIKNTIDESIDVPNVYDKVKDYAYEKKYNSCDQTKTNAWDKFLIVISKHKITLSSLVLILIAGILTIIVIRGNGWGTNGINKENQENIGYENASPEGPNNQEENNKEEDNKEEDNNDNNNDNLGNNDISQEPLPEIGYEVVLDEINIPMNSITNINLPENVEINNNTINLTWTPITENISPDGSIDFSTNESINSSGQSVALIKVEFELNNQKFEKIYEIVLED